MKPTVLSVTRWLFDTPAGLAAVIGGAALVTAVATAAPTTVTNDFAPSTVISSSAVNTNFSDLAAAIDARVPDPALGEVQLGTNWIDGKPIYRTTLQVPAQGSQSGSYAWDVAHSIISLETLISVNGAMEIGGDLQIPLPWTNAGGGIRIIVDDTNVNFRAFDAGTIGSLLAGTVTLDYTKTP